MEIWSKCDICGRDIPVGELCYGLKKGNCICKDCCTGFENCTFTLEPMPTITPPNEWVSVEDLKPEDERLVLSYSTMFGMSVALLLNGDWYDYLGESGDYDSPCLHVTHWMPLPSPPDRRPPEGEDG